MNTKSSSVNFSHEQYETLRNNYRKWWDNSLGRPIVPIATYNHESNREVSHNPGMYPGNAWDFSISPEQFIDAHDYYLSTLRWYGDSFPYFATTSFGPGTLAAFLGCRPVSAPHTVWFEAPRKDLPISELHFEYDENNPYLRRVLDLYEAAMDKWHGSVVVGMVDMGGVMDVLQSFRGAENLLMDLYDEPDEVLRCIKEIQELWFVYYDKINAILSPEAEGYSQWFRLYGEKPGYILQSDFSYMISPDMFDIFVAPELASSAARMHKAVYHMDGIGQIPHLDSLLAIPDICGIQWVPGDGTPSLQNWDDLLERILASGKKLISRCQGPDGLPISIAKNPTQLYFDEHGFDKNDENGLRKYAELFGIEINL